MNKQTTLPQPSIPPQSRLPYPIVNGVSLVPFTESTWCESGLLGLIITQPEQVSVMALFKLSPSLLVALLGKKREKLYLLFLLPYLLLTL